MVKVNNLVLLYVHQKRDDSSLSLYLCSHQGSTPLSLISLSILSVSILHTEAMTYCLSQLGRRVQKTPTHTTEIDHYLCCPEHGLNQGWPHFLCSGRKNGLRKLVGHHNVLEKLGEHNFIVKIVTQSRTLGIST